MAKSASAFSHQEPSEFRWDLGISRIWRDWLRVFSFATIHRDLLAAASVALVAVPLNLGIGVTSGVPPQIALVTAGICAPVAAAFGGTPLAVTGPAAVISVLVAQAVNSHGLVALPVVTFGVGVLQLLLGVANGGWVVKLVPVPVIAGFTTGVGVLVSVKQLPWIMALPFSPDMSVPEGLMQIAGNICATDHCALGVGALSLATLWMIPRIHRPAASLAPLAAVGIGTLVASAFENVGLGHVATVGEVPALSTADLLRSYLLQAPWDIDIVSLVPTTLLIFAVTSVESLLSCSVIEKVRPTAFRHDPSQELVGQGLANITSGCFGGMPVTSVISRSLLNASCTAETRLASAMQGLFVLAGTVMAAPLLSVLPMPALAAVMLNGGLRMMQPPEIKHAIRVQSTDALPFSATVLTMLSLGLAEGVVVGLLTSLIFSGANWNQPETARMSFTKAETVRVSLELYSAEKLWELDKARLIRLILAQQGLDADNANSGECPECWGEGQVWQVMSSYDTPDDLSKECPTCQGTGIAPHAKELPCVWSLNGPLNFLSVFSIADLIKAAEEQAPEHGRVVFDLYGCRTLDLTGAEALLAGLSMLQENGLQIVLMNPPTQLQDALTAYATYNADAEIDAYQHFTRPTKQTPPAGRRLSSLWEM